MEIKNIKRFWITIPNFLVLKIYCISEVKRHIKSSVVKEESYVLVNIKMSKRKEEQGRKAVLTREYNPEENRVTSIRSDIFKMSERHIESYFLHVFCTTATVNPSPKESIEGNQLIFSFHIKRNILNARDHS